ncbi:hypothetical protein G5C51_08015 [Streptomyces sp. A7024]|uniref:Uncharacterized protein n=1 Tax=Streptomyces coryli TaxID=1128680 RepID=A0A6G4TVL4_9ACTN|nr:hypothetical protein [Streptomyces coryli]NGN63853.1 hypothetical protein [Streptomyces coryli]
MPTDEVEIWWADQSDSPLNLQDWLRTHGESRDHDGNLITTGGVEAHYPEDEGGSIVVNPKVDGMSEVGLNSSWK